MLDAQVHLAILAAFGAATLASVAARRGIFKGLSDEILEFAKSNCTGASTDITLRPLYTLCDERAAVRLNQDRFAFVCVGQLVVFITAVLVKEFLNSEQPRLEHLIMCVLSGVSLLLLIMLFALIVYLVKHRHSPL